MSDIFTNFSNLDIVKAEQYSKLDPNNSDFILSYQVSERDGPFKVFEDVFQLLPSLLHLLTLNGENYENNHQSISQMEA